MLTGNAAYRTLAQGAVPVHRPNNVCNRGRWRDCRAERRRRNAVAAARVACHSRHAPGWLRHLIVLLEELQALGIAFVSLGEGIDATTPAGKLQMHILGAIAEFERARIAERVKAGLQRARAQGKRLGAAEEDCAGCPHSWRLG